MEINRIFGAVYNKENIMKQVLSVLLCLLCSLTLHAQNLKSLFIALPDSLSPLLTKVNREDFGDFLASDMKAEVRNRFGKTSEMTELTDDYLRLKMSQASEVEMKLLPVNDSVKVICVVHTYAAPAADSHVAFYDTAWRELPAARFLSAPEEGLFYRIPQNPAQADSLRNLRASADMYLLKAVLDKDNPTLSFVYTTPDYLDKETAGKLKPYLRKTPVTYEWREGKFVSADAAR